MVNIYKSEYDERDFILENIIPNDKKDVIIDELPDVLDYRNDLLKVRNQGEQGTCSGQVVACMKEWQEKKDLNINEYFSPQYIFNLREDKSINGISPKETFKILTNYGCSLEKDFRYGKSRKPKAEEIKKAKNFSISAYIKIETINMLRMSLYKNGPCYISFPVFSDDEYSLPKDPFYRSNGNKKFLGGHACTVVGYTSEGFIIRNSWGKHWNDEGYFIFPYHEWGNKYECWTCIDSKSLSINKEEKKNRKSLFKRIFDFFKRK